MRVSHPRPRVLMCLIGSSIVCGALGCATQGPAVVTTAPAPTLPSPDPRFGAADTVLSGFDPLEAGPRFYGGERMLLGMTIRRDGHEQIRFVDIELERPLRVLRGGVVTVTRNNDEKREYSTGCFSIRVRLFDEQGREIRHGEGSLASDFVARGLMGLSRVLHDAPRRGPERASSPTDEISDSDREEAEHGVCTLLAFTTAVNNNSTSIFRGLAMDFIGYQGMLAAILSLGEFSISTCDPPTPGAVRLSDGGPDMPAYCLPVEIGFGRTPVMRCILTVVEPVSPFTITAGVVRAEITRVSHPDDRITVQLLAARRAPVSAGSADASADRSMQAP